MSMKALINREINARRERIRGVIVSNPIQRNFDPSGARFLGWVVDVDIGRDRLLRNVPVKINGPKARFYAKLGSPVFLEKDAQGRYQVVAPADRVPVGGGLLIIDEETLAETTGTVGFTITREPFEFYKGTTPESFFDPAADPNTLVWMRGYDRAIGLPANLTLDSDTDGAEVFRITDKSGNGYGAEEASPLDAPVYRRFDATGGNTNTLSTIDAADNKMDLASNVSETTGGVVSFFILLNKDITGAGNDVILQTADWQILSRRSAGDTWGYDQGGGVTNSGGTIGTDFTLIEIISSSFGSQSLYQDGVLLGTFTPGSTGMANATSHLFNNDAGTAGHQGRLVELLVMDEAVGDAKRLTIEQYFTQAMSVAYAKWGNDVDGFPKIRITDSDGNEV